MTQTQVTPVTREQVGEVAQFLHEHLNRRITPEQWASALLHPWAQTQPNYGAQLRSGERLVGVLCAIYSDQVIAGRQEKFCNPHSWCVLPEFRNQGIGLVLTLIRQPGYHFTMLTPNPKVAEIFRHLRFKDLDDGLAAFPNTPSAGALLAGTIAESGPQRIAALLESDELRDFELHRNIPWLRFVAFGAKKDICWIVYKPTRWKRMPCARIIHVSNAATFDRYRGALQNHLLFRHGMLVNLIETRFLATVPALAYRGKRTQAKLFMSSTLRDAQIRDLYSELCALDV